MKPGALQGDKGPALDMSERRLMLDTTWPLVLIIMTAACVSAWALGVLNVRLADVLWLTFGVALAHQLLSRMLEIAGTSTTALLLHTALNVAAVSGLGLLWSLMGGLAAPAFSIFFALPIVALGLVVRISIQYGVTLYAILVAWVVALVNSTDLQLKLEQLGVPAFWRLLPGDSSIDFIGYGVIAGGSAQLQFMVVFTFAMIGVAATSSIVVSLIDRLYQRLRFVSASGEFAGKMADIFINQAEGLEMIIDRNGAEIVTVSPAITGALRQPAAALIGSHYSAVLPFEAGHVVRRQIDAGQAATIPHQVFVTDEGPILVNIRVNPGEVDGFRFQRVTLEPLQEKDFTEIAQSAFSDICGAIDRDGRIVYLSKEAKNLLGCDGTNDRADAAPLPAGWWQIGGRERHERMVSIGKTEYRLKLSREEFFAVLSHVELVMFRLVALPGRRGG